MELDLNKRYQTLLVLWFALLMSIVLYFLFSVLAAPQISSEFGNARRSALALALTAIGTLLVILSFAVKRKILERSVENQDPNLVQKGLVIACAMCEASALLGVLERFVIGNRESYLLFLLAAAGTTFHFPRRSQLESASYRNPAQLT
jgi:ABC-type transport system involved in cytochrome c biogenesis permease subunit